MNRSIGLLKQFLWIKNYFGGKKDEKDEDEEIFLNRDGGTHGAVHDGNRAGNRTGRTNPPLGSARIPQALPRT